MNFAELIVLAIGLSMDAFAISICKGLSVEKLEKRHMVITGLVRRLADGNADHRLFCGRKLL